MTNASAAPDNRNQPSVRLIEERQGKSSAHRMWIDIPKPSTSCLPYPNAMHKMETVPPGKEHTQRENKRGPKNTMDREFEELKGFKELGSEFSHLTPRVLLLLPGLKRLIDHEKSNKIVGFQDSASEKSELQCQHAEELDLKEYLKLWARSVALALKS